MFIKKKVLLMQMKLLCIFALSFSLSACISRLSRPEMTGLIVNYQGVPQAQVQVGEMTTDVTGQFKLKERRYYAFLVTEILYMEAPPIFVREQVSKSGYQTCYLQYRSSFGGGQPKGAKWEIGTVLLKQGADVPVTGKLQDCEVKKQEK